MTLEEKAIQKIRQVLLADSTIAGYVQTRVYASHISCIEEPKYPAISIHLLRSAPIYSMPTVSDITLQIDIWVLANVHNLTDIMSMDGKIKDALHRNEYKDNVIDINFARSVKQSAGPLLHEPEQNVLHYPTIYNMVVADG